MTVSSRTPEGQPNRCPLCSHEFFIEPSTTFGDAPCPSCGVLLWFNLQRDGVMFYDSISAEIRKDKIRQFIADQLGVSVDRIPPNLEDLDAASLGADSLDKVELLMELMEEFEIYPVDS